MLKFARPRKVAGPAAAGPTAGRGRWANDQRARHLWRPAADGAPDLLAWRRSPRRGRHAGRGGSQLRVGAQMLDDGFGRPAVDLEVARLLVDPDQGAGVHAGLAVDLGHVIA